MSPLIEQQLRALLGQMADVVGEEYHVCFVAKNNQRGKADIVLGDKLFNKIVIERLGAVLEVKK
jgi:RecB family endonuclease NucS